MVIRRVEGSGKLSEVSKSCIVFNGQRKLVNKFIRCERVFYVETVDVCVIYDDVD